MTTDVRPDGITPSATVGPFFAYALTPHAYGGASLATGDLARTGAPGRRIRIEGYILDGDGEPIVDAFLELWQSDADGRYAGADDASGRANAAFTGFGRADVDSNGFYAFETVMPGRVAGPDGSLQAPHANLGIFARGMLKRLFTRIYFEGEPGLDQDPILALVPDGRRDTLVARRQDRGAVTAYTFTIRLQGADETVFFES